MSDTQEKEKLPMNVFVSWSGDRGQHVARTLRKWIPYVLQSVEPWMSHEDIEPGTRWANELAKTLESINFGVICLTPETINTPWVLFEAGALAKALSHSVVCPYLIDLEPEDLKGPLNQFNAVLADREGTLGLFRSMNKCIAKKHRLDDALLEETYYEWWPKIEADLNRIPTAPGAHSILLPDSGLGLEYVSESRGPALELFAKHLHAEIDRGNGGIISMVGTSMRGFLVPAGGGFNASDLLQRAVYEKVELRLMLVNPIHADLRGAFEGRPEGAIPGEIKADVGDLRELGIPKQSVHYYDAGPTVFGIATSDRMLLNPYPSSLAAHAGFTLIVRKTNQRTDIYQQYRTSHFDRLWKEHSTEVPDKDWKTGVPPRTRRPRKGKTAKKA